MRRNGYGVQADAQITAGLGGSLLRIRERPHQFGREGIGKVTNPRGRPGMEPYGRLYCKVQVYTHSRAGLGRSLLRICGGQYLVLTLALRGLEESESERMAENGAKWSPLL